MTDGTGRAGATPQGRYIYSVIRTDEPRVFGPCGIGGRGDLVYTLHEGGLAAIVSGCPLGSCDPTRDNALAHERVNQLAIDDFTLLPMSFGTVFRSDADVAKFLHDTAPELNGAIDRLEGKVELGVKVVWNREEVIREIEADSEELRRLREEILSSTTTSSYFSRMQLSRVVDKELESRSAAYQAELFEALRDVAEASRATRPSGERMILNASFLVERARLKLFDDRIAELAARYESRLSFAYTGPWPAYNFVRMKVRLERNGDGRAGD